MMLRRRFMQAVGAAIAASPLLPEFDIAQNAAKEVGVKIPIRPVSKVPIPSELDRAISRMPSAEIMSLAQDYTRDFGFSYDKLIFEKVIIQMGELPVFPRDLLGYNEDDFFSVIIDKGIAKRVLGDNILVPFNEFQGESDRVKPYASFEEINRAIQKTYYEMKYPASKLAWTTLIESAQNNKFEVGFLDDIKKNVLLSRIQMRRGTVGGLSANHRNVLTDIFVPTQTFAEIADDPYAKDVVINSVKIHHAPELSFVSRSHFAVGLDLSMRDNFVNTEKEGCPFIIHSPVTQKFTTVTEEGFCVFDASKVMLIT